MPTPSDENTLTIAKRLLRAHQLLELRRPADAEAEFRAVLELDPDNALAFRGLATCARLKDNLHSAREFIGQALRCSPDDAASHFEAGQVFSLLEKHSKAIRHFEWAVERAPENADFLFGLAIAFHRSGGLKDALKAEKLVGRVLALDPSHAPALSYKAAIARRGFHFGEAEKYLQQLGRADPEDTYLQSLLAEQRRREGHIDMALEHHLAALRQDPGNRAELYNYYETYAYQNRLWRALAGWDGGMLFNPVSQFITTAIVIFLLLLLVTKSPAFIPEMAIQALAWLVYLPLFVFWVGRLWSKWVAPRHRWHFPFTGRAARFLFLDLSGTLGALAFGAYLATGDFVGVTTAVFLMIYGAIAAGFFIMAEEYFIRPLGLILVVIYLCGAINLVMALLGYKPFQPAEIIAATGWILIILGHGLFSELRNRRWWRKRTGQ
ncbi:MAG: tetratricopeptide repeat protein [Lewinellaceae bacterium]|nr:tetratricopeptide repeat protein [Lewinellaceae bacterium]